MKKRSIAFAIESVLDNFIVLQKDITKVNGLYYTVINEVEKILIKKIYDLTEKNKKQAARILGISRNTLNSKMKNFNISDD